MIKAQKFKQIGQHALFWLVYSLLISTLIGLNSSQPFIFVFTHYIISVPAYALFAYPLVNFVVPLLLNKKINYGLILMMAMLATTLSSIFILVLQHLLFYGLIWPKALEPEAWFTAKQLLQNVLPIWIPAMFLAAQKYMFEWAKESKAKSELEKENLQTELKMLKNQLNPHFLFNTLNNLYTLALMKSDKTPEMISRLSDMFQFILYECNAPSITLGKEMSLINNYVELQQLRYGERLLYSIESDVDIENFRIAPMMLFTFVENCFKHGSGSDPGVPWIKLSISKKKDSLRFIAENSKPQKNDSFIEKNGGIGLENLRKRLDLLYEDNYELIIDNNSAVYRAELTLKEL